MSASVTAGGTGTASVAMGAVVKGMATVATGVSEGMRTGAVATGVAASGSGVRTDMASGVAMVTGAAMAAQGGVSTGGDRSLTNVVRQIWVHHSAACLWSTSHTCCMSVTSRCKTTAHAGALSLVLQFDSAVPERRAHTITRALEITPLVVTLITMADNAVHGHLGASIIWQLACQSLQMLHQASSH